MRVNFAQWCNGSTTGFGPASLGSSPGWATLRESHSKNTFIFRVRYPKDELTLLKEDLQQIYSDTKYYFWKRSSILI